MYSIICEYENLRYLVANVLNEKTGYSSGLPITNRRLEVHQKANENVNEE